MNTNNNGYDYFYASALNQGASDAAAAEYAARASGTQSSQGHHPINNAHSAHPALTGGGYGGYSGAGGAAVTGGGYGGYGSVGAAGYTGAGTNDTGTNDTNDGLGGVIGAFGGMKVSALKTHANAKTQFKRQSSTPRESAFPVSELVASLAPLGLTLNDLLFTSDKGRLHRRSEKISGPSIDADVPRSVEKISDPANLSAIAPKNIAPGNIASGNADISYSVTNLALGAVCEHYYKKYDIDMRNVSLEYDASDAQIDSYGRAIAELLARQQTRSSMGVSIELDCPPEYRSSDGAQHRISIALHKSNKLTMVVHDSIKNNYQLLGHESKVDRLINQITSHFNQLGRQANPASMSQQLKPASILIATDKGVQSDDYACATVSLVVLKELLMNRGALIGQMAHEYQQFAGRFDVQAPPAIARITQATEKIGDAEMSSPYRLNSNKAVKGTVDTFGLPFGQARLAISEALFITLPSQIREEIDVAIQNKGYKKTSGEGRLQSAVYNKTIADPQNGYLRAKSLAYAKVAIDSVARPERARAELEAMFEKFNLKIS